jgi:tetratricopeptide (TPR) repeat protein
VRETLERILASETFGRSERARNLLRYLVEQEQAGHADRLKGFAIAVDVFGKDADFDPSTDAVVRVQAGRLRELLAHYFAAEGAAEPIRITIPRGSYVPAYEIDPERHAPVPDDAHPPPDGPPQHAEPAEAGHGIIDPALAAAEGSLPASGAQMMRQVKFFWGAMAVIILMLGFLVYRITDPAPGEQVAASAAGTPAETSSIAALNALEALPPVYISLKSQAEGPARVASVLRTALSGFDTVDFIGRDLDPNAPANPLQFVFQVDAGLGEGEVSIELQHSASGKVLLSRVLPAAEVGTAKLDDTIADILSSTVPASGTIYGHIDQMGLQTGLTACLLLNDDYYLAESEEKHEAAYRCFEELARANAKSPLIYAEMASLHMEAVRDNYSYPRNATAEQALALGYRAVQMVATSPYAHRSYGFLNQRIGNSEEATRWMRKAYELNTYDLSMAAAYAYALIFSGNYKEGATIMERAVEASSAHPSWWDYGLFLAQFMLNDVAKSSRAAEALVTAKRGHYLAVRAIAADCEGKPELARQLIDEIVLEHPKFASDPRAFFVEGQYPPAMTEKLLGALRQAGLGGPS